MFKINWEGPLTRCWCGWYLRGRGYHILHLAKHLFDEIVSAHRQRHA